MGSTRDKSVQGAAVDYYGFIRENAPNDCRIIVYVEWSQEPKQGVIEL